MKSNEQLVVLEHHSHFDEACSRARRFAQEVNDEVIVVRSRTGWQVLASAFSQAVLTTAEMQLTTAHVDDALDEEYRREVLVPLHQDMRDEQDAWSRSRSEGWFYDDGDDEL